MNFFFWDTSALAKRYIPELGTSSVNYLIETVPKNRMFMLILSLGEILSVLVRKRNSKQISDRFYSQSLAEFNEELLRDKVISIQSVYDKLIQESLKLIEQYSINATDAVILECALDIMDKLRATGDDLVLVTTDIRLSNAAKSSGLKVWNPEKENQSYLESIILADF
jgi:hypothetical protein